MINRLKRLNMKLDIDMEVILNIRMKGLKWYTNIRITAIRQ